MLPCVRTTLQLDDDLIREAKHVAVRTGRTLTAVIEDALRQSFANHGDISESDQVRLKTFRARLQPGADLDDSASLLELMEPEELPR